MTATYTPPKRVLQNIARRHAARTGQRCIYGCRSHARLYAGGTFCDDHAPQPTNPTPDPTRTLNALRATWGSR